MAKEIRRAPDVSISWRRISTGNLSFLYSEEKILPNYLRSPKGSCHDVCKYGNKHESQDESKKRANRRTLSFDSSLPSRKKALTKSVFSPSFGDGNGHEMNQDMYFSRKVCDENAERIREKKTASESRLDDSNKLKKNKKTVSHSFKTLETVEHNKLVTTLKLKSVAQTAAMALRRSIVNRKKINNEEPNALEPKKKCKDMVEEKILYVVTTKTEDKIVESDQNIQSLKTKGTNFSNDEDEKDKPESLKVVLKHQETEKKSDTRDILLNNVIEETTNKGKVKALVGAFESLISLHEKKSYTTTS